MPDESLNEIAALAVVPVAVESIAWETDGWDVFLSRRLAADEGVAQSLRTFGQLSPVVLEELGKRRRIVDGFARVAGAKALGWKVVWARIVPEGRLSGKELFLRALALNGRERFASAVNRAAALERARRLAFSSEEIALKVAPRVGVAPAPRRIEEMRRLALLAPEIQEAYERGALTEEQLKALSAIHDEELRGGVCRLVFMDSRLSVNETREVMELLEQVAAREDLSMPQVLREVLSGIGEEEPGRRARAAVLALRRRRHPLWTQRKEAFRAEAKTLRAANGVDVQDPGTFEGNVLRITLSFEDCERLRAQLAAIRRSADAGEIDRMLSLIQGRS
ncbi:MAG: ParB/RepB/Spo0J family partition protein [Planctomycetota bacterium]